MFHLPSDPGEKIDIAREFGTLELKTAHARTAWAARGRIENDRRRRDTWRRRPDLDSAFTSICPSLLMRFREFMNQRTFPAFFIVLGVAAQRLYGLKKH